MTENKFLNREAFPFKTEHSALLKVQVRGIQVDGEFPIWILKRLLEE